MTIDRAPLTDALRVAVEMYEAQRLFWDTPKIATGLKHERMMEARRQEARFAKLLPFIRPLLKEEPTP